MEVSIHLVQAEIELERAVKICEKYGIPLSLGIDRLGEQNYMPKSFSEKWEGIDLKNFEWELNLTDAGRSYSGWMVSKLCF